MQEPPPPVTVDLRIPGDWSHPRELIEHLPEEFRLTPEELILPDGSAIAFCPLHPNDEFAGIFRRSCRQPAEADELAKVDRYTVNAVLSGPGGSLEAARKMMQGAAALVRAGGAGVFIDNSGLAHGGKHWLELSDDGGPDAVSFAFVSIIRGDTDVFTMGMHVLGLRDVQMRRADIEVHGFDIIEVIRYLSVGNKPVDDGHILADLNRPRFHAIAQESPQQFVGSAMYNPFGRLKLVSMRDIAEAN